MADNPRPPDEFYEDDEPFEDIVAACAASSERGVTADRRADNPRPPDAVLRAMVEETEALCEDCGRSLFTDFNLDQECGPFSTWWMCGVCANARALRSSAMIQRMASALRKLEQWDMLHLTPEGRGAATADAPWARALIAEALRDERP